MSRPAICLSHKVRIKSILQQLQARKFDGFPIVNGRLQCIGLINRHALIVLLKGVDRLPHCEETASSLDNGPSEVRQGLDEIEEGEEAKIDTAVNASYQAEGGRNEIALGWEEFNVDFHSSLPDVNDRKVQQMATQYAEKVIDLRPYMIARPFTVFENDPLQKCLDTFRLMNLRHMPVLSERDG